VGPVISREPYGKVPAEASGVRAQLIDRLRYAEPAHHRLISRHISSRTRGL
jgi:hypothetical protein